MLHIEIVDDHTIEIDDDNVGEILYRGQRVDAALAVINRWLYTEAIRPPWTETVAPPTPEQYHD